MGVEMRVHIFFPLLVRVPFAISGIDGWRGQTLDTYTIITTDPNELPVGFAGPTEVVP
jgi:hypothetical protein